MSRESDNQNAEIAIKVSGVVKDFALPHEKVDSMKSYFTKLFNVNRSVEVQHALRGVSFEVKKGEFFGIVGRNGSGKSTLLKILAGIYQPTKGEIEVNGKLVPFIELGVGFNPELTGRENVYLNGALLGFSKKEMEERYEEIVSFAELEKFMDQKLKNYSSGMQVRLAFSIAIRAQAEILLIDEVLAVGDESFQRKCYQYFAEIRRQKQTVILVTHNMEAVQEFCDRAILIDKGHKTEIGTPLKITQIYRELNNQSGVTVNVSNDDISKPQKTETKFINLKMDCEKTEKGYVFDLDIKSKQDLEDPIIAMGIYRDSGEQVYRWTSDEKIPFGIDFKRHTKVRIEVSDVFPVGVFTVNLYIRKRDRTMDYAVFNEITTFEVKNRSPYPHATFWKIPDKTFVNDKEVADVH